ncbi:hypothetical protein ACJMK2_026014 [Sinanodonta woodiana]|uniref:Uncharacterized protein n=1 Tax=Sinanodonta woodiana TaxID=1069815 RepID=A0ABD3XK27_SINWO
MMARSLLYCLFIPVPLLAALCADLGPSSKFVCIGSTVKVFENITSLSYEFQMLLYKTFSGKEEAIAVWSSQNVSDANILGKYTKKVIMENGTIYIHDFQTSDQATYVMLYDRTKRTEMQLCAVAPPTKRCKADIQRDEQFLIASLYDADYCGTPRAYVHWMEYPDMLYISETVIEVLPGTKARTYTACIEGEALKCMKDSAEWNNCKNYTIPSITEIECPTTLSDIPQIKYIGIVTICIVFVVLVIVGIVLFILRRQFGLVRKKTDRGRTQIPMRNQPLLEEENVSDGAGIRDEDTAT